MLKELRLLLASCLRPTSYEQFRIAIVEDNVLLKNTAATRRESFRRLRELYALGETVILFRALRDMWDDDHEGQSLLALLCACARDSILRATSDLILALVPRQSVTPQMIEEATEEAFPGRYNPTTLANVGRHAASSWQQSGHLSGRLTKTRARASPTPGAVAYALLLGHLEGVQGDSLFTTRWARLLDVPPPVLRDHARRASQLGWLEYRHGGGITELSFHHLLRPSPEEPS